MVGQMLNKLLQVSGLQGFHAYEELGPQRTPAQLKTKLHDRKRKPESEPNTFSDASSEICFCSRLKQNIVLLHQTLAAHTSGVDQEHVSKERLNKSWKKNSQMQLTERGRGT